MSEKTCFVIIGYGIKTDHATGREIDLDKTYTNIIEPVFKELGFICFRASDIIHSGVIDTHMYENIIKADFVLADITTLNPNVLYELGIRHAVRKNTTLIISDKLLKYPFDLNHILIDQYEHLGKAIDYDEVHRFRDVLKNKVEELVANPKIDSPLYTFFPNLEVPKFTEEEIEEIKESIDAEETSLSDLIQSAEEAKNNKEYQKAIEFFRKAIEFSNDNDFIIQRMALVTYKLKEPNERDALYDASKILEQLNPKNTTDIETLGLSGAINKRLFEVTGDFYYLKESLWYYEKGFYIANDYYNGINLSYINNVLAANAEKQFDAYAYFGTANIVRGKIIEICNEIINSKIWEEREDKHWVLLSLAEAHFGIDDIDNYTKYFEQAKAEFANSFSVESFEEQIGKLKVLIKAFKEKFNS